MEIIWLRPKPAIGRMARDGYDKLYSDHVENWQIGRYAVILLQVKETSRCKGSDTDNNDRFFFRRMALDLPCFTAIFTLSPPIPVGLDLARNRMVCGLFYLCPIGFS